MNLQGRNLEQGLTGGDVRLLQSELTLLNLVIPDDERQSALFGPATLRLIQNFQKTHNLPTTGIVDPATAKAINSDVDTLHPPTSTVSGRVYSSQRAGVGGLRIQAVDKNAGPDLALAEGVTNDRGAYSIRYSTALPGLNSKSAPDLQVRALNGATLLSASEIRYDASPNETLDVVVPDASATALASEHETLTAALSLHFTGNLRDLQEAGDRSDITYLANKTGWDARAVAMAALADQFSSPNPAIEPKLFYALLRAGVPANEDVLYQTDAATLSSIWHAAIDQGLISGAFISNSTTTDPIAARVAKFQAFGAQQLLTAPALSGVSPLKDLLQVSGLTDAQKQQFATLYAANRNDTPAFWKAVTTAFGQATAAKLQLDGQLSFLTINNAPLMQAVKQVGGSAPLTDPVQLAVAGFHRSDKWATLLTANTVIPPEIPGDTPDGRKANYAIYLAAQVRLSYPTASIAQMVKVGGLPVQAPDQVSTFLMAHQDKFTIGAQPIQQYIARNGLQVSAQVVGEIKRIERLYQITPSDDATAALLKREIDSAYRVAHQDREAFLKSLTSDVGADQAAAIYDRAVAVQNAVLNVVTGYLTARNGLTLGASQLPTGAAQTSTNGQILRPAPLGSQAAGPDVIAYPTLEQLFGSMDFCSCDACRSVLSPAAYLVDLLQFIDTPPPAADKKNPQDVLLGRRPDIQHLPLTCENTNTALPYIDIVNETLEYYITNAAQALSLENFTGHDTGTAVTEDLMASPQFVIDTAYNTLRPQFFPTPLPFHQPLENLRLYFGKFDVQLPDAMERLRKSDDVERGANVYGWRDILMEQLGLSREEYRLLTDSSLTLANVYGFAGSSTDAAAILALSNAKQFARRISLSYEDQVALLKTKFVNPNSELLPKLARLGVPFKTLQDLQTGAITDAAFDALLPQGAGAPDPAQFGGDIKAWVKKPDNFARIMSIITLAAPPDSTGGCNFDKFELRYSKPPANPPDNRLGVPDFLRILRFVRLWKKTGWTMDQTDAAICALFRGDLKPVSAADLATAANLDAGFNTLLPRLGIVMQVMSLLNLTVNRDLLPLLACWADTGTFGDHSLYRQLFLNPAILSLDQAFADDGYGNFPQASNDALLTHSETIRAALNLTAEEFDRIIAAVDFNASTKLTMANITAIYKRGWLARKLRLSLRELFLLSSLTGLDPFAAPDPPQPGIMRFLRLIEEMKARSLKSAAALYLIWNQDLSGKSKPAAVAVTGFARTLRADFAAVDDQFALVEDPGGDVARGRMALVYGQETADALFALLDNAVVLNVNYTHTAATLEAGITAADSQLAYDNFQHRLSHTGLLTAAIRDALKAVAGVAAAFQAAVDALFAQGQDISGSFFLRFPELKPLYDTYVASTDPLDKKRAALLAAFSPALARLRKRQQALQRVATAASVDLTFAQTILDPGSAPFALHAAGDTTRSGLDDVIAIETPGLAAQFFFRDTATGTVDKQVPAAADLDYGTAANPLPANPAPGAAISAIWSGLLEAPESGFFNIAVDADAGATVSVNLAGQARPLIQTGTVWRNNSGIQLAAGTLYDFKLTVAKTVTTVRVRWETSKRSREIIPGRYIYPSAQLSIFQDIYVRFLKAASLGSALGLTANELAHFGNDTTLRVGGKGWLNVLAVTGDPAAAVANGLLKPLESLLNVARIKSDLSPGDEQVLTILQDPASAAANTDSPLFSLTRWDKNSLADVLAQFGGTIGGLAGFELFRRVYDAFQILQKLGVPGAAAIRATTNAPDRAVVRDFGSALRSRYDAATWRDLVQPINNQLRSLQRDALVAYILQQMRDNPATASIDTPDKLFEYFLMDVQMEPCMQTSRIRHALSAVQLFVERCSMNLEPDVSAASINADRWAWMKRYRVWEANRKVFLFPENWLEPELRDDKSPFFKEIESQLLQSDITEDSAASAYLTYLTKLEEVAKLELCGMHYIEPTPEQDLVMHVVGRTAGAHRKYYYRRLEHGTWSAWDQIKLDIPDNPVVPVVWQDRVFVFWLRLIKKGPDSAPKPAGHKVLSTITSDDLPGSPPVTLQAVLHWSEYVNGKWQAAKTSDINDPADIDESSAASLITPERIRLAIRAKDASLRIGFWTGFLSSPLDAFLLHNTHSLPVHDHLGVPSLPGKDRFLRAPLDPFGIYYLDSVTSKVLFRPLPKPNDPYSVTEPVHELDDRWNAPFFYEDRHYAFLVTSEQQPVWIRNFPNYGVTVNANLSQSARIAQLVLSAPPAPKRPVTVSGPVDQASIRRLVSEDAYINKAITTTLDVTFNGRSVGPAGTVKVSQ
ncbi:MAG: neuraminidase-like domain-containing protein [Bryobacteraceae bacterium]